MKRGFLRTAGRALIGALLFAQMAIAAYACPGLAPELAAEMHLSLNTASVQTADAAAVADCSDMAGSMDPSSPNLCAEHCRYGQQSDLAPTLAVPAVILTTLNITPYAADVAQRPLRTAIVTSALTSADPPHAILHCCSRT
ncbi:MAG: hypothetical protein WKG52_13325 [Variovorax sp.]